MYCATFSTWKTATLVLAMACASAAVAVAEEAPRRDAPAEPAAEIQAQIRRTVDALNSGGLATASEELHRLKQLTGDSPMLVEQIAVFVTAAPGPDVMMAHLLLHPCFPMDVDAPTIVQGLAELVHSEHSVLREWVEDEFTTIDGIGSTLPKQVSPPDYGAYYQFIRSKLLAGDALPVDVISFMFRRAPESGLLTVVYAVEDALGREEDLEGLQEEEINNLLWAEHMISDAIWKKEHNFAEAFESARGETANQILALADHDEWWVRLYAIEILLRHPEFGTPEMMQRLKNDTHEAVREAFAQRRRNR